MTDVLELLRIRRRDRDADAAASYWSTLFRLAAGHLSERAAETAVAELDNSQPMTEHQLRKKAIEIIEWAFDRENPLRTVERYEAKRLRQKKDKR